MNTDQKRLKAYRQTAASTQSPGALVLMLFDGALRFLELAANGFSEPNFIRRQEQINNNLIKTQNILSELRATLNMEKGGEFASTMFDLYGFMFDQLRIANMQKQPEPIEVVRRLLGEIRDAWAEMLSKPMQGQIAA